MNVHFSSATPEWATPQELFDQLNKEFNFTLDPCATKENAKCPKFYTKEDDGLSRDWTGEKIFMNPPYGREIGKWIKKLAEVGGGSTAPRPNRHQMVPRLHLWESGDKIYQGAH